MVDTQAFSWYSVLRAGLFWPAQYKYVGFFRTSKKYLADPEISGVCPSLITSLPFFPD